MLLESAFLPYAPTGRAFLQHVHTRYLFLSFCLAGLTALLLAWQWIQPRHHGFAITLFDDRIDPIAFCFVPYPLLSALMLGWAVKRSLPTFPATR